ncbi:MAG: alpha-galactosidase [bacterium]|nr:alpha-galactosidase [bacterium]
MVKQACVLFSFFVLFFVPCTSMAVTPSEDAMAAGRQWFDRLFPAVPQQQSPCFMETVKEDVAERISRRISWRGMPFQIGEQMYEHGIAFNANRRIRIHAGQPVARFQAVVGLENNDDTRRGAAMGNGSVRFHVYVDGKPIFESPVMRLADVAMELNLPLDGAESFEIEVDDAGDGRGWDQAVWANATLHFANPEQAGLRLQDIPWKEDLAENPAVFSFVYDGISTLDQIADWKQTAMTTQDGDTLHRQILYRDPQTNLAVRIEADCRTAFPALEWVVYLKNEGEANTPIIQDIQALDIQLPGFEGNAVKLHWAKGGVASFEDFAPQTTALEPGKLVRLQPGGGRSSNQVLPFFNCFGGHGGWMMAVGWTGEWAMTASASPSGIALKAGLAKTHLVLYPGEEIRTPRMLLLPYDGDRWQGQNLLRQYILAHHRPQVNGKPMESPITCGNWGATSAEVHLDNIRKIIQHDLPLDYYWIDAEWYGQPGNPGSWAVNVGNWNLKPDVYPQGFKPLSSLLREHNRELMLWFEPERVYKGTPWYNDHKDWLLDIGNDSALWNLGHPEALAFLIDFISSKIEEFGLGCYRQDFNIDPLPFWQAADAPDRVGMTEIRYIEGLYAFWDGLLQRHPNLIIDNCASGGRRIDLETTGRATPFWRTDGPRDAVAHQCHTMGLLPWVPFSATSQDDAPNDYEFRSSMCSSLCLNWWVRGDAPAKPIPDDFPFAWAKETLDQYRTLQKYYHGDFYPLTAHTPAMDAWMAYQLDRPDLGEGMIVALRRPASPYLAASFGLVALDAEAPYLVTNLDTGQSQTLTGKTLTTQGLAVELTEKPGSGIWVYKKVQ